jgi:hypothetical protein
MLADARACFEYVPPARSHVRDDVKLVILTALQR